MISKGYNASSSLLRQFLLPKSLKPLNKHYSIKKPPVASKQKYRRHRSIISLGLTGGLAAFVTYDGVNEFTYCGAVWRFMRSVKTATLITFDYLTLDENNPNYENQLKAVHQQSANRLLETCLLNGGLYIKVGQGIAAINHILPVEYTSTLSKLQDECFPTSREDVQNLFRKDFGQLPEEIYDDFDYKPIAAASLAQVFKAKLNGETVAVKVQYGDLQKRFVSDLGTIIFLQEIVEFFFKNYNFGWILNDVRENLVHELNFINEAQNAERCANDMRKFSFVYVPKIYWDFTKTRVLTLEWMEGFKISDLTQIKSNKLNIKDIDIKLFKIFSEQIFNTGFVHADPHPGNIFVRPSDESGKADIIILDHGLYEEIPKAVSQPLCEFWEATVLCNENKMKQAAAKLGIHDYLKFAEVLFQQPLRMKSDRIRSKLTEADIEHMQKVAKENFDSIMKTLKEMPRNMLFVVRNLNTIRAISRCHGDIVDRPRHMARYAQLCIYTHSNRSPMKYLRWLCRRGVFEFYLWRTAFQLRCINLYFNFLYLIGRAPESAKTLLGDITSAHIEPTICN